MGYKTYGGRPCNLECIEKGPPPKVREFVRPVKFVLIEGSRKSYWYKLLFAALLSFANALLTVNFIIIFFYTTSFKNNLAMTGHIYLSTLGLQYMMFLGILSMNGLFGPSVPMKSLHRDRQHALIQLFAIVFCCLGFFILYFRSKKGTLFSSAHSVIGIVATALAVTVFVAGALAYFKKEEPPAMRTKVHNMLAAPAVIASTCCFLTGIAKPGFRDLMPMIEIYVFMFIFCIIYTLIVIVSPGVVATVSAIVAAIFGVTAWLSKKNCFIMTHMSIGILTFLVCSVCVCLGVVTDVFVSWAGSIVVAILIGFIVFNTLCILTPCFLRCMMNV